MSGVSNLEGYLVTRDQRFTLGDGRGMGGGWEGDGRGMGGGWEGDGRGYECEAM